MLSIGVMAAAAWATGSPSVFPSLGVINRLAGIGYPLWRARRQP